MFAAASGARLAHRHNKATIKKQLCSNNVDGLQVQYKTLQKSTHQRLHPQYHHYANYTDAPGVHGPQRNPQKYHQYHSYTSSKLYSSDSESVLKLSSSYIDLHHHGRIPKFGHVDFEGKAAWQDRELGYDVDRRESVCVTSDAATHRFKQKEAHKRWVKRNRIHDSTFGDCSSEEDDVYGAYGVQSTAANALLYIGLGTMCIGMIIAFVGTGEKGFKTIELRLIGPSLIGAGVMIIILRVMLCVCPSKCLKFNKHKHKNSTSKLNSEDESGPAGTGGDGVAGWKVPTSTTAEGVTPTTTKDSLTTSGKTGGESKKRVSIVEVPTTTTAAGVTRRTDEVPGEVVSHTPRGKVTPEPPADGGKDAVSIRSDVSDVPSHHLRSSWTAEGAADEMHPSRSDVSISSLANGFLNSDSFDSDVSSKTVRNASKFEAHRSPKNAATEIVLSPSNLNELHESD